MQVNWFNISIILVLIVIDFYLQKKINNKGYVFLCINKGRLRYPILVLFVASFIYFVLKKQYLLILLILYILRIIDKLIYIDKK
ncbi:hypothetical protein [uncultured Catenibacterium sp.]|uniref:hypothetical protein n=1 Tax=uncultured Catenibacterium sp. TaxID=286142 RepID=UPI00262E1EE2|nr:hypothetical protein [uncultured Catenibacterium sp.]